MRTNRLIRYDRIAAVCIPLLLFLIVLLVRCGGGSASTTSTPSQTGIAEVTETTADTTALTTSVTLTTTASETTVSSGPALTALSSGGITSGGVLTSGGGTVTTTVSAARAGYPKDILIVLDPGHGGKDGGAQDDNDHPTRFEKDDNLRLALAVRDSLKKYPHVDVKMTRETDVFVELNDRCVIANNAKADFFISLHRNSSDSGNGVEIWINNEAAGDTTWDKWLAEYILELLEDVGISANRGVQTGYRDGSGGNNYFVNRYTEMPSCLIEMGFMTSDTDNTYFDTRLNEYADAIAAGVYELLTDKGMVIVDG